MIGTPPPPQYPQGAIVRKVDASGKISFKGRTYLVSKAFRGEQVRLVEDPEGGISVFFGPNKITILKELE